MNSYEWKRRRKFDCPSLDIVNDPERVDHPFDYKNTLRFQYAYKCALFEISATVFTAVYYAYEGWKYCKNQTIIFRIKIRLSFLRGREDYMVCDRPKRQLGLKYRARNEFDIYFTILRT